MGYTICYDRNSNQKTKRFNLKRILSAAIVTIFIIGISVSIHGSFRELLLPGNADVTEQALHNLAENMRTGVKVQDALAAFCNEIIDYANIPK